VAAGARHTQRLVWSLGQRYKKAKTITAKSQRVALPTKLEKVLEVIDKGLSLQILSLSSI
jgi:hypothetical protein